MTKKRGLPARQLHIALTKAMERLHPPTAECILDADPRYWKLRAAEALVSGDISLTLVLVALLQKEKLDAEAFCTKGKDRSRNPGSDNQVSGTS